VTLRLARTQFALPLVLTAVHMRGMISAFLLGVVRGSTAVGSVVEYTEYTERSVVVCFLMSFFRFIDSELLVFVCQNAASSTKSSKPKAPTSTKPEPSLAFFSCWWSTFRSFEKGEKGRKKEGKKKEKGRKVKLV
jgi:hypothetical protein